MARIFITGSSDGLGQLTAKALIAKGHAVVLHARNSIRAKDAIRQNPGAETVLTGDLSSIEETKTLAAAVNKLGSFDTVIHNAGVYRSSGKEIMTVNVLAPYMLTALIAKPKHMIYLSSGMHMHGSATNMVKGFSQMSYSDSKLFVVMLCLAAGRLWPDVRSNAVNPGWVPTKMGGRGAPDNLEKGYETQVWLATENDFATGATGQYFFHQKGRPFHHQASDVNLQQELLGICEEYTGVHFPAF